MCCEKFVAFALTGPNDGSDVVRFETRARLDWRGLNGAKRWIGLGPIADLILIWARGRGRPSRCWPLHPRPREDEAIRPAIKPRAITGKRATVRYIRPMA